MAARKRTITTVRLELERLVKERQMIDQEIETLRKFLSLQEPAPQVNRVRLRPFILKLIGAEDGKLTVNNIVREVELSGYKPRGNTPTRILTQSELSRLVSEEKLSKDDKGRYSIHPLNF
jgi:hypothetical protein